MHIKILDYSIHRCEVTTRMPFKYGIATMTEVPHVFVSVKVRMGKEECTGISADHLPPKWFTKEPAVPIGKEIADMEASIGRALDASLTAVAESPFMLWWTLYQLLMDQPEFPPLLQHFGISLVERAVLDAVCRCQATPLWRMVRENRLGIDLGSLSTELAGTMPSDHLPEKPLDRLALRHTVGMADFLREADIPADGRLDDGLPQSLEACIRAYGLREFKLKLSGDAEPDLRRLRAIAQVIHQNAAADFRFSLDGNEQFGSPGQLRAFGDAVYADPELSIFFGKLFFIEQPLSRKVALADNAMNIGEAWPRSVPVCIDESDGAIGDFPRALELGYSGVSHKNCKGVFKGIRNKCLIAFRQQQNPGSQYLMTGEDLANIGPVALTQDLAVQALLGNASVERNGHHYFRGLSMFPKAYSEAINSFHPDLYCLKADGYAYLNVEDGMMNLASVNASPFGTRFRAKT